MKSSRKSREEEEQDSVIHLRTGQVEKTTKGRTREIEH